MMVIFKFLLYRMFINNYNNNANNDNLRPKFKTKCFWIIRKTNYRLNTVNIVTVIFQFKIFFKIIFNLNI